MNLACVNLISRSLDNLKPLYNEIEELEEFKEGSVTLIQLDLLDFENVKILTKMIESLKLSESGALNILVACAELQNQINTNFTANWYLLKKLRSNAKKV